MVVNYKAQTIGIYIKKAGRLLPNTKLDKKEDVIKKATNKLANIVESDKNMSEIGNCIG